MMRTPAYSAGARYERAALRAYLERQVKREGAYSPACSLLRWIRGRQARYDKRSGGL